MTASSSFVPGRASSCVLCSDRLNSRRDSLLLCTSRTESVRTARGIFTEPAEEDRHMNPHIICNFQKYDMAYVSEYGIIGNDAKAANRQPGTTPLGWAESGRHQTRPIRRGGQASRRPPTCQLGAQGVGRRASATGWGDTE